MVKKQRHERRSTCPISASLDVLGDRWSLLVVRDLLFGGCQTYKQFLGSGEGIATNILADRLERLEATGIVTSRPDPADGRSVIYQPTAKGIALAPVLLEMGRWGVAFETGVESNANVEGYKADRDGFLRRLQEQWQGADGKTGDQVESTVLAGSRPRRRQPR